MKKTPKKQFPEFFFCMFACKNVLYYKLNLTYLRQEGKKITQISLAAIRDPISFINRSCPSLLTSCHVPFWVSGEPGPVYNAQFQVQLTEQVTWSYVG